MWRSQVVSQPANSSAGISQAKEIGERMFNQSASCASCRPQFGL